MSNIELLSSTGIIAIIRGDHAAHIGRLAQALYSGGVRVMEVTLNSPDALAMISTLAGEWTGKMLIGAGTVLTESALDTAIDAGAQFYVSPDVYPPVIERAIKRGVEAFPGAFTPTEIRTAVRAGARYVKLFPAMPAGAAYLRQIRAPLDDVKFVPTGGIDESNIAEFVKAGAVAFGIGGSLVPKIFDGSDEQLRGIENAARGITRAFALAKASHG